MADMRLKMSLAISLRYKHTWGRMRRSLPMDEWGKKMRIAGQLPPYFRHFASTKKKKKVQEVTRFLSCCWLGWVTKWALSRKIASLFPHSGQLWVMMTKYKKLFGRFFFSRWNFLHPVNKKNFLSSPFFSKTLYTVRHSKQKKCIRLIYRPVVN